MDEKPIRKCCICGEDILAGEQFCQYDGGDFHMECYKDNIADVLIERGETEVYWEE